MDRTQTADEIQLFCNNAPENTYLVRVSYAKKDIDTFIWLRCIPNINAGLMLLNSKIDAWDVFVFKSIDGLLPIGSFGRYITDGKFDKDLYLNPDKN